MAEESKVAVGSEAVAKTQDPEIQDRGLFDFMGKKEDQKEDHPKHQAEEEVIAAEMEKVHVSEPEPAQLHEKKNEEVEGEKKKESILEKLHRSGSGSSSSSSDEEEGEGGEKKKKKKKEKKEKKESDTSIPIEKCEGESTQPPAEEKKGFLEKIKGKLPGQHKKQEEVPPPAAPAAAESASVAEGEEKGEKKGILEKIKEKLPGYHPKTEEEKEKEKEAH